MLEHGIMCKSVSVANIAAAMEQQPIDYSDIDSNPDICVYEKQQQKHVRWLKNTPRYLAVQAEIGRLKLKALEAPKQSKPRQRQVKQLLPPRYTAGQQRNTSVTKSHLAPKTAAATAKHPQCRAGVRQRLRLAFQLRTTPHGRTCCCTLIRMPW